MLNVVGAGWAYPDTELDNQFLELVGGESLTELELACGAGHRRSCLSLDYIRETKNVDPKAAFEALTCTPTELALKAAKRAIETAGIEVGSIGMILGEACLPHELTPSEAQRLGSLLGLKVPAYDIVSGCGAFPLLFDTVLKWRDAEIPDYVLCFSSNTPTLNINYSSGPERVCFGDGAAAYILSKCHPGKLSIEKTVYGMKSAGAAELTIPVNDHVRFAIDGAERAVVERSSMLLESIDVGEVDVLVPVQSFESAQTKAGYLDNAKAVWFAGERTGYTFGSSGAALVAERWDDVGKGQRLLIVDAGFGRTHGAVLLKGMQ